MKKTAKKAKKKIVEYKGTKAEERYTSKAAKKRHESKESKKKEAAEKKIAKKKVAKKKKK